MKKKIFIFLPILILQTDIFFSQVGINNSNPQSTLDITSDSQSDPSNTSGIIIPRVTSLNITDAKETGLLVFWASPDIDERGFYWWDGEQWNPFVSISKISSNQSITYVSAKNDFKEGNMTQNASTNDRTLEFESIKSNNSDNFEITDSGELKIKKKGYYHIQAASFISKVSGNSEKRDQLDMKIYVNGTDASLNNSDNFNIEGSNSFPFDFVSISINASGILKLNADDLLSMKIIRSYRDTDPSGNIVIIPDQNAKSNVTLRYMGDF